jgi:thiamine biosynthesis protein ThiI
MKGLLLVSGGIDSPVAGYLMLKKGVSLGAIHFSNLPFASDNSVDKVNNLVLALESCSNSKIPLFVMKHGIVQKMILDSCNRRFQCVLCKRFMFRVAEHVALSKGYDFLVTGESVGQVASQTLENLFVTSSAVRIPIMRPLVCMDKLEIVSIANDIGTFAFSTEKGESCSLAPHSPLTRARLFDVEEQEKSLDVDSIVRSIAEC